MRVGVDALLEFFRSFEGLPSTVPSTLSPAELGRQQSEGTVPPLLDVRTPSHEPMDVPFHLA